MKKVISIVLCLTVALMLFAGCASVATYNGSGDKATTVTLRIVTMDGEKLFDDKVKVVDDSPTVYMALKAAAEAKKLMLDVVDEQTPENMFLNGIGDLVSENPNFWMFYVNQALSELGMGTQALADNDVVEFIYGDYNNGYVSVK